jgi:hypothetical protein
MMREIPGTSALQPSVGSGIGVDVNAMREQLFPRGPVADELRSEDSDFMANWRVLNEDQVDPVMLLNHIIGTTKER